MKSKLPATLVTIIVMFITFCQAQQPAFPGAEGYGRFTTGGRGGAVIAVTNLNDDGPGSLRAAVETEGPRTVIFRISGTIVLKSELAITQRDLTIAGQTAPGDGICIRDYPVIIDADNVILRFLRIRLGDVHKLEADALTGMFRKDIMVDHCSMSWGIDEVATIRDNVNSTVQWCIVSESLNHSYHSKGDHGYGGIWGGEGATFHHNLLADNSSRNPRFTGSRYSGKPREERVDFRNNVIFNWGFNSAYGGEGGYYNLVANYYKYGPATRHKNRIVEPYDDTGKWYVADNFVYGYPAVTRDNWAGGVQGDFRKAGRVNRPFPAAPVITQSPREAYAFLISQVGAVLPKRDPVDTRVIHQLKTGTATTGRAHNGIIDSQTDVGGWPELKTYDVPVDSDADGMPDKWELERHLNPQDPADRNGDRNGDGYTNLEDYLNSLVRLPAPETKQF